MRKIPLHLNSFRLRIALMAALLAGIALVGFGGASWLLIYKARLTRLDSDLKNQLRREAAPPRFDGQQSPRRDDDYWQSSEAVIGAVLGSREDVALLVLDSQEQTIYRSQNWLLVQANLFPSPRPPRQEPPPRRDGGNDLDQLRGIPPRLPNNPENPQDQGGNIKIENQSSSQGTWRIGAIAYPSGKVAIAVNLRVLDREMHTISRVFGFSIPLTLILVAIAAWVLSERALKPLYKVTATLRGVTATDLSQRVSGGAADVEFGELLQVFNQMMDRLERSFKQASRFSADAAHELKTPLAILQGELERTLHHAKPGSQLQQRLSGLLDEVGRLKGIIRKLLLLSLADAGQMRFTLVETDLSILLLELVDDIEMLAPNLEVQVQIAPKLWASIDRDLLIQVLYNLITNAIKYNQPEGWLKIHARYQDDTVAVTIQNKSLDMSPLDRQQVFDRFYRGNRSQQIEGVGLGLALSREIARGHGGELKLDKTPTGSTAFTLTLPKPLGIKAK
jgi:two-component system, OmpR family, heavy metal sensor histidine kinase CusS